ncbi:MAG: hypothetical protein KAJ19_28530, partial [Gammaproteobacteria bacterium]|nr:hypothetical protein [Gammaproteobacteria bacterium]
MLRIRLINGFRYSSFWRIIKMKTGLRVLAAILLCITLHSPVLAKGRLKGSPHDLSVQGSGRMCSFCHTPHGTSTTTPLWNHKLSDSVYKIYQSSSLDAKVGQPTGSSKMCLSCHDGTVALTHTIGQGSEGGVYITPGDANLGTDLSDDHPISFTYTDALSAKDPQIRPASTIPQELRLDQGKEVQCTTCHDAHDNQYGAFVVMDNERSGMCVSCHDLDGWSASGHQSSTAMVADATDTYLRKSRYATVAENACLGCHRP